MLKAFGRLLNIASIFMICAVFIVFGLRTLGLHDQHEAPFDTGIFTQTPWVIAYDDWNQESLDSFLAKAHPDLILAADLQRLKDGLLVVLKSPYFLTPEARHFVGQMTLTELTQIHPRAVTLDDFLVASGVRPVLLRGLHLNKRDGTNLLKSLKASKPKGEIIFQTGNLALKRYLKQEAPLWIYANTPSELGKLKLFSSIFIEAATSLDADVFIFEKASAPLIEEVHRRHRKALIWSDDSAFDFKAFGLDGVIVTRPDVALRLIDRN